MYIQTISYITGSDTEHNYSQVGYITSSNKVKVCLRLPSLSLHHTLHKNKLSCKRFDAWWAINK